MSDGPAHLLRGCRVLIIEDEYFLANDLERTLKSHGAAEVIGPVSSFEKALALVQRDGFDVAVIDIKLHDSLAYPIADELLRQNIPFVFATGYSSEVIPERFRHVTRIEKPYHLPDLVRELAEVWNSKPAS